MSHTSLVLQGWGGEWPTSIEVSHENDRPESRTYVPFRTCLMTFDDDEFRYRCSACGGLSETYRHPNGKYYVPEFCPCCGAKVVDEL